MKICIRCGERKIDEEFFLHSLKGRQSTCKECRKVIDHQSYERHKEKRKEQAVAWQSKFSAWCDTFKQGKPCTDCGEVFHPCAMQWDHLRSETKKCNVALIRGTGLGYKAFLEEIAKCELVCSNCHAIRTFNRQHAVTSPTISLAPSVTVARQALTLQAVARHHRSQPL